MKNELIKIVIAPKERKRWSIQNKTKQNKTKKQLLKVIWRNNKSIRTIIFRHQNLKYCHVIIASQKSNYWRIMIWKRKLLQEAERLIFRIEKNVAGG